MQKVLNCLWLRISEYEGTCDALPDDNYDARQLEEQEKVVNWIIDTLGVSEPLANKILEILGSCWRRKHTDLVIDSDIPVLLKDYNDLKESECDPQVVSFLKDKLIDAFGPLEELADSMYRELEYVWSVVSEFEKQGCDVTSNSEFEGLYFDKQERLTEECAKKLGVSSDTGYIICFILGGCWQQKNGELTIVVGDIVRQFNNLCR